MTDVEMMLDLYNTKGEQIARPLCCKCLPERITMDDNGECSDGCCDYFKCPKCGYRLRVECAD